MMTASDLVQRLRDREAPAWVTGTVALTVRLPDPLCQEAATALEALVARLGDRCLIQEAIHAWLRDHAGTAIKMTMTPAIRDALADSILTALSTTNRRPPMGDSSDPSMTDTATLLKSVQRDIGEASARVNEAYRWLQEARNTMHELIRRADLAANAPPKEQVYEG